MANEEHVALLKQGVDTWNKWRDENPRIHPDLTKANLAGLDLKEIKLTGTDLKGANLSGADLSGANLVWTRLRKADLTKANLTKADLTVADLSKTIFTEADLSEAKLVRADLTKAKLKQAILKGTDLTGTILKRAVLSGAILQNANLRQSNLIEADLRTADLTGCRVYGVSAWRLTLDGSKQQNLLITEDDEPEITVDSIEVAQFVYLLLHNQKIRTIINTITSKAVLILGRFTPERKPVLDALREELRKHDYVPILFDFDVPASRDITETVSLLARMARFIVADLTDPSSIPKELEAIVPTLAVPVQPLIEGADRPYAMFKDYWKYDWVLPVYRYEALEPLRIALQKKVISPAEAKVKALEERRRAIEAELTKPQ